VKRKKKGAMLRDSYLKAKSAQGHQKIGEAGEKKSRAAPASRRKGGWRSDRGRGKESFPRAANWSVGGQNGKKEKKGVNSWDKLKGPMRCPNNY